MSEDAIVGIIVLSVVAGIIFLIYRLIKITAKRTEENFKKLTQKYTGLRFSKDKEGQYGSKNGLLLKGKLRENELICFTYITGAGDSTIHWTKYELCHNLELKGYKLKLLSENFVYKIGKKMNLVKEMELGILEFDSRFLIQSDNESATRSFLNKRVRDSLVKIPKIYFGNLEISSTHISYQVPYQLANEKVYEHFEKSFEITQVILEELKRIYR